MARTPDLERRQELLDRIVDYLAEHGLAQATLRPMAASLGVSSNRLVHHFGSKEALLTAALARSLERQIAVQDGWVRRHPHLTTCQIYRKWWKWMNASPANLALVRLNYEAAALNPEVSGLDGEVRAHQIGVWCRDVQRQLMNDGLPPDAALLEATLAKATFTGLVTDLVASGDRRRLSAMVEEFARRLERVVEEQRR